MLPLSSWARGFALFAPYERFPFATRFEDDDWRVGVNIFADLASEGKIRASPVRRPQGLFPSFKELRSELFEPDQVDPLIRHFYERSSTFDVRMRVRWDPLIQPLGWLFYHLVARRIGNLMVPPRSMPRMVGMESTYLEIDADRDGAPDFRAWLRRLEGGTLFYVGAFRIHRRPDEQPQIAYLSCSFPLPFANFAVVLAPRNLPHGGFELSSLDRSRGDAGTYLVFPHRGSFSMIPGLGLTERFRFRKHGEVVRACHEEFWLGRRAFTIDYVLAPSGSA